MLPGVRFKAYLAGALLLTVGMVLGGCAFRGAVLLSPSPVVVKTIATSTPVPLPTPTPTVSAEPLRSPTSAPLPDATPSRRPTMESTAALAEGSLKFGEVVGPSAEAGTLSEGWSRHTDGDSRLSFACPDDWRIDNTAECYSPTGCVWVYPSDAAGIYLQPVAEGAAGAPVEGRSRYGELAALLLHASDTYQAVGAGSYAFRSAYVIQDATRKAYVIESVLNQDFGRPGPLFLALDALVVPATGRAVYMNYYHDGLTQLSPAQYRNLERFIWSLQALEAQDGALAPS
ncbi:MAG: hypothetical protein GXY68_04665 [Chloroflexi bacterium]|nr:hypothetical protein [Chloroflexota bacterium]